MTFGSRPTTIVLGALAVLVVFLAVVVFVNRPGRPNGEPRPTPTPPEPPPAPGPPLPSNICEAARAGRLIIATARAPDSLNPVLLRTEEARYVSELVFDGLVNSESVSGDGTPVYQPALLKNHFEPDPLHRDEQTLVLREGVTWHDGRPLTSDDVVYTWKALHASQSPLVGWLDYFIADLRKLDDRRLRLLLKVEASEESLYELLSTFKILPSRYKNADGNIISLPTDLRTNANGAVNDFGFAPVGTGPFKIVKRIPNTIELESHTSGTPASPARLNRLQIERIPGYSMRVKDLKDGAVGMALDLSPAEPELDAADVRPIPRDSYSFYLIAYNLQTPPFSNASFRRAINAATDKRRLFTAYTGLQDPQDFTNTSVFPHNFEFLRQARQADPTRFAEADPFDQNAARQLLRYSQQTPTFTLLISQVAQGEPVRALANEYQQLMQAVGVNVVVKDENPATFQAYLEDHTFQAAFLFLTGFDHLYDFRELFGLDDKRNPFGLHDPDLERSLAAYGTTLRRIELMTESENIHRRVEALAPGCFLFTVPRQAYVSNFYSNVALHPYVGFATTEKWVVESNHKCLSEH